MIRRSSTKFLHFFKPLPLWNNCLSVCLSVRLFASCFCCCCCCCCSDLCLSSQILRSRPGQARPDQAGLLAWLACTLVKPLLLLPSSSSSSSSCLLSLWLALFCSALIRLFHSIDRSWTAEGQASKQASQQLARPPKHNITERLASKLTKPLGGSGSRSHAQKKHLSNAHVASEIRRLRRAGCMHTFQV